MGLTAGASWTAKGSAPPPPLPTFWRQRPPSPAPVSGWGQSSSRSTTRNLTPKPWPTPPTARPSNGTSCALRAPAPSRRYGGKPSTCACRRPTLLSSSTTRLCPRPTAAAARRLRAWATRPSAACGGWPCARRALGATGRPCRRRSTGTEEARVPVPAVPCRSAVSAPATDPRRPPGRAPWIVGHRGSCWSPFLYDARELKANSKIDMLLCPGYVMYVLLVWRIVWEWSNIYIIHASMLVSIYIFVWQSW